MLLKKADICFLAKKYPGFHTVKNKSLLSVGKKKKKKKVGSRTNTSPLHSAPENQMVGP